MKKTARSLAIILAVCTVLSLMTACGDTPPAETTAATTPAATPESTPEVTTPETIPEATEPESTPAPGVEYNVSYDLDGGIDGGNPTVYNNSSELRLLIPVRPGYDFVGWTGSGIDTPTDEVTVPAGNTENLSFKANWTENSYVSNEIKLDTTHFGKDDGLTADLTDVPLTDYYATGNRGEGIFLLKTVYTEIDVDGEMDAAYAYGIHVKGKLYYDGNLYGSRERSTFDFYLVRGQDGSLYGYMDVTDPDVVVNNSLFTYLPHHCDSVDFYYEINNEGSGYELFSFVADPTGKYLRGTPPEHKVKLTDKGYAVEFTFDKNGEPFLGNDEMSFGIYINDSFDYVSNSSYKKAIVKHASKLNPILSGFMFPGDGAHDAVRTSLESATGKVNVNADKSELSGDILTDTFSNKASIAVIYDENATAQTIIHSRLLCDLLRRAGADAEVVCENKMDREYDCEILFGMTEREESKRLISALGYNGYGVSVDGDTITVVGWNEAAAEEAYSLVYEILEYGILGGKGDIFGCYTGKVELSGGDKLPVLDGFDSITDVGEGAYSIYKLSSNAGEFEAYTAKLEKAGYTLYTSRSVGSVLFATYFDSETVVNVQHGGEGDHSLRVVAEPLSNTALPSLEKPEADTVCTPSITMTAYDYAGSMCFIIQLSNGHFVIVDGGHNNNQREIFDVLRAKAPDKNNIVIEAWILTHFHQDHIGGFIDYMGISSMTRYTTVKSVIYNFPADQVFSTASHSPTDMNNISLFYNNRKPAMTEAGTTFYQARTGQKYYFGDAEIEILWTYEDIMPFNVFVDRSNPTCIGFSLTIAGQKIMFTGDSSGEEFTMAYNKYGDYLKSDFVQLSHHGQGDGYSPVEFYRAVGAPYVFNPGIGDYYGVGEAWARDNCEKYFMRGALGKVTVSLPYSGGEFESTKAQ